MRFCLTVALLASGCASQVATVPLADASSEDVPERSCDGHLEIAESAWRAYAREMKHERIDVLVRGTQAYADAADVWAAHLHAIGDERAQRATRESMRSRDAAASTTIMRGRRGQRTDTSTTPFVQDYLRAQSASPDSAAAARAGELGDVLRERMAEADQAVSLSLNAEAWIQAADLNANSIAMRGKPMPYAPEAVIVTETYRIADEASRGVLRSCPMPQLRSDEEDETRRPMRWQVT